MARLLLLALEDNDNTQSDDCLTEMFIMMTLISDLHIIVVIVAIVVIFIIVVIIDVIVVTVLTAHAQSPRARRFSSGGCPHRLIGHQGDSQPRTARQWGLDWTGLSKGLDSPRRHQTGNGYADEWPK